MTGIIKVPYGVGIPAGVVITTAGAAAPLGGNYIYCNGQAVDRVVFADLFTIVGDLFGAGDGLTTFNVPDFRGEFLRGVDNGVGLDTGRALGSNQGAATGIGSEPLTINCKAAGAHTHAAAVSTDGLHSHTWTFYKDNNTFPDRAKRGSNTGSSINSSNAPNHTHTSVTTLKELTHNHILASAILSNAPETVPNNIALRFWVAT